MPTKETKREREIRLLQEELERRELVPKLELARRNFLDFVTLMTPGLHRPWFQLDLIDKLNRATYGEFDQIVISMPPGHGKSSILELWSAWCLGRDPREELLVVSHTATTAGNSSKKVREWVEGELFQKIFPDFKIGLTDTQLQWGTDTKEGLSVDQRGQYEATGISSGTGGKRFTKGIVDDPYGGSEDANSPTTQVKVKEAFGRNFLSRVHKGKSDISRVKVVVTTRWNTNDLVGIIEEYEAIGMKPYEKIVYKAKDEVTGKYLWEESEIAMDEYRTAELTDTVAWEALYQQNPLKAMGTIFKKDTFRYCNYSDFDTKLDRKDFYFCISVDPATSSKTGSDDAVAILAGINKNSGDIYILDMMGGVMGPTEFYNDFFGGLLYKATSMGFAPRFISIEQVNLNKDQTKFKTDFMAEMKRRMIMVPVYDYHPKEEKLARIKYYLEPLLQQGRLYFLNKDDSNWNQGFKKLEDQLIKYPQMSHDDYPDAVTQAVIMLGVHFNTISRKLERNRTVSKAKREYQFLINP